MDRNSRLRIVDILKGINILFVIITHYSWTGSERLKYLFPFWIEMAVPAFMIISGYVNALSYECKGISVNASYSLENIWNKCARFAIPFSVAFIVDAIVFYRTNRPEKGGGILFLFIQGGVGPGSYYFPVMIQFVFLFPIIFALIKKNNWRGLFFCGVINVLYELIQTAYGLNEECYRLIVCRYILAIAIGCYIAVGREKIAVIIKVGSVIIGAIWIITTEYMGYEAIIIPYWSGTSFMAVLFIAPIISFLFKIAKSCKCFILETLGKASFNIFLVQMIYYLEVGKVYNYIKEREYQLIINIIVCVGCGVIFYYLEQPVTKYLIVRGCTCLHNTRRTKVESL